MQARRCKPEHHVAFNYVAARQQLPAFRRADREAREIVVAAGIEAGHFRCLAADQRRASLQAALGDALDDRFALLGIELAGGEIVEEQQRLGALHNEVVDAHGDKVDADRVVPTRLDGDLQFRADAVVGRHQNRIGEAGRLQVEQPAEAADLAVGARPARSAHMRLDAPHQFVARVDVDAGIGIGQRVGGISAGHRGRSMILPGSWHEACGTARTQHGAFPSRRAMCLVEAQPTA